MFPSTNTCQIKRGEKEKALETQFVFTEFGNAYIHPASEVQLANQYLEPARDRIGTAIGREEQHDDDKSDNPSA
jgi:hypothetical protein